MAAWADFKTTNPSNWGYVGGIPSWKYATWNTFVDAITNLYDNINGNGKNITGLGSIGVGTSSPADLVHLYGTSGISCIRMENTSAGGFALVRLKSDNRLWQFGTGGSTSGANNFYIFDETAATLRFIIYPPGVHGTTIGFGTIPTYASDAAAGSAGLATGDIYKDSSGFLHIKL